MKKIKFRWRTGVNRYTYHYREIILPDDAQQMLYTDEKGVDVYEYEYVYNGAEDDLQCVEPEYVEANNYFSIDHAEIYRDTDKFNDYVEHEPIDLTAGTHGKNLVEVGGQTYYEGQILHEADGKTYRVKFSDGALPFPVLVEIFGEEKEKNGDT